MGGVIGLSAMGLGVLVLSSVVPVALPEPDALAVVSEVPDVADANGAMALGGFEWGDEDVGDRRMLKRALWRVVVSVDGADLRLSIEGAEYVWA